ncbi:MAG: FAD-dependent oxidoreductase [Gammaproteobacteria bacterium]|nr:FAD-dependent oxidoreductase [Gammaproteobacteria bacterium]
MPDQIPKHAQVVVIGGGIVGCSVAYHLTKLGWNDVVLLERKTLTCGTTWHAAGLVGQLRATHNLTRLAQYTTGLFQTLEQETGQATGFKQNGSLALAADHERFEELKRGASMASCFGLEVEVITPADAQELWPMLNIDDLVGAVFLPNDGQTNPTDTTQALAKGAKMGGASVFENTKVTAIHRSNSRVTGVATDRGDISAEYVVNCGGMWAREIGQMCDVTVPLHAAEHFYVVTEPIEGLSSKLPVLRDPGACNYYKEDAGKLLVGMFEPVAKPWGMDGIPEDHAFETLPEDLEHIEPYLQNAMHRVPVLEKTGIQVFFNGPESFTPDDRYLLGEAPGLKNFFVCAGFNSIGIQSSGGVGKVLSEWIVNGRPPMDLWDVDIRRVLPFQGNQSYLRDRTVEALGLLYEMHWPFRQPATSRGVRCSPLHDRLAAAGACFGEMGGWERANWFAPKGVEPVYKYSYGRQNWFEHSAEEHMAVREAVGLFDQTSFAKFSLKGSDAEQVLNRVCANNVAVPVGKIVYTQWLNERGGIEADLTVTRIAEDEYLIITAVGTQVRDFHWVQQHIPSDAHVGLTDVTSGYAVVSLMGPSSRALLSHLSEVDMSNEAFPFGTSQVIDLGYARVRASRITFVGELGWELYISTEFATGVYDTIMKAGPEFGLKHAGYHALNSLRMEKGYRHWGHDITDEDTPLEAGLGFTVAMNKNTGFIGQEVLLRQQEQGLHRRLVQFKLDDSEPLLYHEEPIWRDGTLVGRTTSGMYGHTVGSAVALGYVENEEGVTADYINAGSYEIEVAGERYPATVSLKPFYDPKNERVKM